MGSRVRILLAAPTGMYFTYILACLETGRSYVGQTDNLIRRFHQHREGLTRTTREKLRNPVVIHWEAFATRREAMQRERYYKSGAGHRVKQEIIKSAWLFTPPAAGNSCKTRP